MTAETESLICDLLERAVAKTTVTHHRTKQRVDINWFRNLLQLHWTRYVPVLTSNCPQNYEVAVEDNELVERLQDAVGLALEGRVRDDRIQTATIVTVLGYGPGFKLEQVVKRLLIVAIGRGPSWATRNLLKGIKEEHAEYKVISLLNGVRVENEIEIRPGIRMTPLPTSSDKMPPIFQRTRPVDPLDHMGGTIITVDQTVSPVYADPESFVDPKEIFLRHQQCNELPDFDIGTYCDALSLVSGSPIEWITNWNYTDPDQVFVVHGEHISASSIISHDGLRRRGSTIVDAGQVEEAVSLYASMKGLEEGTDQKLQVPIRRWIKSKTDETLVDSFIDLGIALESLYLDGGNRQELSYRLRTRAALFLRDEIQDRMEVTKNVNEIYEIRSQAVHQGTVKSKNSPKELKEKAEELCRESIIKVIHHARATGKLPEWSRIELGEPTVKG